jgi:HEPN domain-containing protein
MNSPADYARALLSRARDDGYVLERLAGDANAPAWVLGFHAQQAVEKALKAVLFLRQVEFPRTHNLSVLLELLRRQNLPLPPDGEELARLIPFGVALRYENAIGDDEAALDREWASQAVAGTLGWAEGMLSGGSGPATKD